MQRTKYGRGTVRPAPMSLDELRRILRYDRETGVLTWNDCPPGGQGAKRMKAGSVAGCKSVWGYVVVRLNKVLYPAHRLIWFMETGVWPREQIDHINEVKSDNRWANLRAATHAQNTHYRHQNRISREGPKPPPELSPMPLKNDRLEIADLRNLIAYDPDSGKLFWRVDRGGGTFAGKQAGTVNTNGYVMVKINNQMFAAHRIAYATMTGDWPEGEIDHINTIKSDNRWSNLRLATRSQNQHAKVRRRKSKTGFRGVSPNGNGFKAQIMVNRKLIHFPTRATAEEAYADYCAAARRYHGEFARLD